MNAHWHASWEGGATCCPPPLGIGPTTYTWAMHDTRCHWCGHEVRKDWVHTCTLEPQ